jgi:hypothetical protein
MPLSDRDKLPGLRETPPTPRLLPSMAENYYGRLSAKGPSASWDPESLFDTGRRPPKRPALPSGTPAAQKRQRTAAATRLRKAQPAGQQEKAQLVGEPPRDASSRGKKPHARNLPGQEGPAAAQTPGTLPPQRLATASHYRAVQTALDQLRDLVENMVDELPLDGIGHLRITLVGSLDQISSTFEEKISRKWGKKGNIILLLRYPLPLLYLFFSFYIPIFFPSFLLSFFPSFLPSFFLLMS